MFTELSKIEQDPIVRAFFQIIEQDFDQAYIKNILLKCIAKRKHITTEHFAYLLFVSLQYMTNMSYDNSLDVEASRLKIRRDLVNKATDIIALCTTKNVSTNIIERYSALQIVLALTEWKNIIVADIGCSLGLGSRALNTEYLRGLVVDDEILKVFSQRSIDIDEIIGVDVQEADIEWQKACFLPECRERRSELQDLYDSLIKIGQKITFRQCDAATPQLNLFNGKEIDVIWTSSMLYQLTARAQDQLIENIRNTLKPKGFWANAYYRYGGEEPFASKDNPYVVSVRFKDDWESLEVLESPSDCIERIIAGADFNEFIRKLSMS